MNAAIRPNRCLNVSQRLQSSVLPHPDASGDGYVTGYNCRTNSYSDFNIASCVDLLIDSGCNVNRRSDDHHPVALSGVSIPLPKAPDALSSRDLEDTDMDLIQLQARVHEPDSFAVRGIIVHAGRLGLR